MRRYLAAGVVLGCCLVVVACSDDGSSDATTSTAAKDGSTETTSRGSDSKGFSVETPEGQVSVSLDGELPPNWPADFPLPKGSKVAGSGSLASATEGVMVGVYTNPSAADDVFGDLRSTSELNPSEVKSISPGGAFLGRMDISGTYDGSVTVTAVDDTTYIIVVLNAAGGSETSTP